MGEAVLGRKLGNKAMFWGTVGGTIPDLDVITKPLMTELQSLAFHRGISHSFLFAVLFALLFGWMIRKLYDSQYATSFLRAALSLFLSCIPISIVYFIIGNDWNPYLVALAAILVAAGIFGILTKTQKTDPEPIENPSLRSWQWMFFLAFFTHALLDTFTMYGTQLLAPFSNYRAAIASISVADPVFYTIPFVVCLFIASRFKRTDGRRKMWNYIGLGLSCGYLIFTLWNKQRINGIFEKEMAAQNITYNRYITGPTIFNNFLWGVTAETDDAYYMGQYSVFDSSPVEFLKINKQYDLLVDADNDETINTLRWFSDNFYSCLLYTSPSPRDLSTSRMPSSA